MKQKYFRHSIDARWYMWNILFLLNVAVWCRRKFRMWWDTITMKHCIHKLRAICVCSQLLHWSWTIVHREQKGTAAMWLCGNEWDGHEWCCWYRGGGLFAVSRRCVRRRRWTAISMTAVVPVGVSCVTTVWSPVCSIIGTSIVAWVWCCVVSRGSEWASGWMISFTLVPDVRAVAILPVGDIRDDLGASVRQLNTVFTLDSVSVACLMSVVIITWGVIAYRVSELVRLWLKQKQEM